MDTGQLDMDTYTTLSWSSHISIYGRARVWVPTNHTLRARGSEGERKWSEKLIGHSDSISISWTIELSSLLFVFAFVFITEFLSRSVSLVIRTLCKTSGMTQIHSKRDDKQMTHNIHTLESMEQSSSIYYISLNSRNCCVRMWECLMQMNNQILYWIRRHTNLEMPQLTSIPKSRTYDQHDQLNRAECSSWWPVASTPSNHLVSHSVWETYLWRKSSKVF